MPLGHSGHEDTGPYTPAVVPDRIRIGSMLLSIFTLGITALCVGQRLGTLRKWRQLSLARILLLGVYINSFIFVAASIIFKDLDMNLSRKNCTTALWFCLTLYMVAKMLVYFFLVEKAYIVRATKNPRLKDRIYIITCFGVMIPYLVLFIMIIYWRIGYIDQSGSCIIGIGRQALIPLIVFDLIINIVMTTFFVIPLRRLHSYRNNSRNGYLRTVALRTFIGSVVTLIATICNVVALSVLNGEAGWLCLMTCNSDVLLSVVVLHWVTSSDQKEGESLASSRYAEQSVRHADRLTTAKGVELQDVNDNGATYGPATTCTTTVIEGKEGFDNMEDGKIRVTYEHKINVEGDSNKLARSVSSRTGSCEEILPRVDYKKRGSDSLSDSS